MVPKIPDGLSPSMAEFLARQLAEQPPTPDIKAFPESERSHVTTVWASLELLQTFVNNFGSALALFDHVERLRQTEPAIPFTWQIIAAKEGVMSVWHFREALGHLISAYRQSPVMMAALGGRNALKAITGEYAQAFPVAESMRHTNAHPVEHLASPQGRQVNPIVTLGGGHLMVYSSLRGRELLFSVEGTAQSLEISDRNRAKLYDFMIRIFQKFRSLDRFAPDQAQAVS